MIIDRETYKTIEYYFYNYHKLRAEVMETREDILKHANYELSKTGIHGTTIINPTEQSAIKLEKLDKTEKWLSVVDKTVERFKGTAMEWLITMCYIEKQSWQNVCMRLNIERATYWNWKAEVIYYAALKASREHLIEV